VNRESLKIWIVRRDREFARYMSRPEAKRALGLTDTTILSVARAGLIRWVTGREHHFPSGFYFYQEDIAKIKNALQLP
jgi:hypothetical protein